MQYYKFLILFLTIPYFLLENILCLALPEPPKIEVSLLHSLADFSEKVVYGFILVNIDQHTFGVVLHPAGLQLEKGVVSAMDLFVVSKNLLTVKVD